MSLKDETDDNWSMQRQRVESDSHSASSSQEQQFGNNNNNEKLDKPAKPSSYPKSVLFIIGNEFCERFAFYGMRAVLSLFFTDVLSTSDDAATIYFHLFAMLNYLSPVAGAIIADSYWGKFKTIFYVSILYAIGNLTLAFSSAVEKGWLTAVGLVLIALGTGGIKPCVAAFGGDQFGPGQEQHLQRFFSWFYIAINLGGLLSTAVTPILREDVQCLSRQTCFPLAFGLPAGITVIAVTMFVAGRYLTSYNLVPPANDNIVFKTVKVVAYSLSKKLFGSEKKNHWLDHASDKFDKQLVDDIKVLMRILFLYLPIPVCWALMMQQGSRWTLQARTMDSDFFGWGRIKPDQMQLINLLLIILLTPVFDYIIYPLLDKCGFHLKPLKRMVIGGLLAAASFGACGLIQVRIDGELPVLPKTGQAYVVLANGMDCRINLTDVNNQTTSIGPLEVVNLENRLLNEINFTAILETEALISVDLNVQLEEYDQAVLLIKGVTRSELLVEKYLINKAKDSSDLLSAPKHSTKSAAFFLLLFNQLWIPGNETVFILKGDTREVNITVSDNENSFGRSKYEEIEIFNDEEKFALEVFGTVAKGGMKLRQGGGYVMFVTNSTGHIKAGQIKTIVKPNSVKMLFQLIQYFLMTASEVMFEITAIDFAYSQSPISMKSVQQSVRLLTVAFGNLIVVVVATSHLFSYQSQEFFFFAGLMTIDMIIFAIMAYFYIPYKGNALAKGLPEDDTMRGDKENVNKEQMFYLKSNENNSIRKNSHKAYDTSDNSRFS